MSDKKENINLYGKVAILPKNTAASKGIQFLENIKVKKTKLWYLMVEKYTDEEGNVLQLVKYNQYKGVDLEKFVSKLKEHYINAYKLQESKHLFDKIEVTGNDKFAIIKNIPDVKLGGVTMIARITEDLVKLLK